MIKQKYQKELNRMTKHIVAKYKPEKIILFGSLAHGKITRDSDIDLLVVKDTRKDYWQRAKEISGAISGLRIDVPKDIINITPGELKKRLNRGDFFVRDIINNGKVIYEKA